eukprot:CAMPEP_0197045248 /NCGR_PEP_ID=MMETSP1384-20130603/21154_1 /TAXON_ID=29189 /ORGANISM="Ammonia sp." /LENGTH=547 /DNA_ID=CAMNT_0042476833 /DNA_START=44 /DNA_END=1687 /DNA_ORIENTATION=+
MDSVKKQMKRKLHAVDKVAAEPDAKRRKMKHVDEAPLTNDTRNEEKSSSTEALQDPQRNIDESHSDGSTTSKSKQWSDLPTEMTLEIISYLLLNELLRIAATSKAVQEACAFNVSRVSGVSLYCLQSTPTRRFTSSVSSKPNKDLCGPSTIMWWALDETRRNVRDLLTRIWNGIDSIQYASESQPIDYVQLFATLNLDISTAMQNIESLSDDSSESQIPSLITSHQCEFSRLQHIDIVFHEIAVWNTLIANIPCLHGVAFSSPSSREQIEEIMDSTQTAQLLAAPNIWTMAWSHDHGEGSFFPVDLINKQIQCCPNLKFLRMKFKANALRSWRLWIASGAIQLPPSLMGLDLDPANLTDLIAFDCSKCRNLRFLNLQMMLLPGASYEAIVALLSEFLLSKITTGEPENYDEKELGVGIFYPAMDDSRIDMIRQEIRRFKRVVDTYGMLRRFDEADMDPLPPLLVWPTGIYGFPAARQLVDIWANTVLFPEAIFGQDKMLHDVNYNVEQIFFQQAVQCFTRNSFHGLSPDMPEFYRYAKQRIQHRGGF